ncbi:MAG: hypothetical protein ACT4PP_07600 [Sporichthyaceae bacterium]
MASGPSQRSSPSANITGMGSGMAAWGTAAIALGTSILAFAGALFGVLVSRRGARDLDVRWRREESMRLLRWACELAVDPQARRRDVGVATLGALETSTLLQREDQALVSAALAVVTDTLL